MMLLLSLFVLCAGLFQLLAPQVWYEITQGWKSYSAADPSDLFIKVTRITGAVFVFVGLGGAVLSFVL